MRSAMKTAGLAGILAAVLAAAAPAQPVSQPANTDNTVREGQAVMTLLGATTSAVTYWVSRSDGWHVVTTVDAVIGQDGDAVAHAVVRFSAVLLPGQLQLILRRPSRWAGRSRSCASAASTPRSRSRGSPAPRSDGEATDRAGPVHPAATAVKIEMIGLIAADAGARRSAASRRTRSVSLTSNGGAGDSRDLDLVAEAADAQDLLRPAHREGHRDELRLAGQQHRQNRTTACFSASPPGSITASTVVTTCQPSTGSPSR